MMRALLGRDAALLAVLLAMFAGFSLTVDGFFDWFNILDRARYWVVPGIIAVPMTFIIATAGIDLSVGSIVALSGIVLGIVFQDLHAPITLASFAAILIGAIAGAVNGGVVSLLGVPPLVVTLATMALFRGIAMGFSKGAPKGGFPGGFTWISQGDLFSLPLGGSPAYVPAPIVALAVVVLAGGLIMRRTWIGRFTELTGESETAARFAGIRSNWLKFGIYTVCGALCGIAALFHTALYATAKADTAQGLELDVIACVVVGGTRISGGRASVTGTLLGLLIIGMLKYGLEMAGVKSQYIIIFVGVLLIATAVFNEWVSARGERA
ncbi:MAG: ABC transporter permease [Candidatus Hydrogenedentes bacterium]|nr:ABC transporter permease [Candidatus Hydrogenedentota bacterium]